MRQLAAAAVLLGLIAAPSAAFACNRVSFDAGLGLGVNTSQPGPDLGAAFSLGWSRCDFRLGHANLLLGARFGMINRGGGSTVFLAFAPGVSTWLSSKSVQVDFALLAGLAAEEDRAPVDGRGLVFGFSLGGRLGVGWAIDPHTRVMVGTDAVLVLAAPEYFPLSLVLHLTYVGQW